MTEPLPTPPSRFAFAGLTGLSNEYEENPFDAVFVQKTSASASTAIAATGSAGESLLASGDKETVAAPPTPFLSSSSLLNTPPPSIPSLAVTPLSKGAESYFDVKVDAPSSYNASLSLGGAMPHLIPTSPAGDPGLGLRLLAEAPSSSPGRNGARKAEVSVGVVPRPPPNRMGRPRHNSAMLPRPPTGPQSALTKRKAGSVSPSKTMMQAVQQQQQQGKGVKRPVERDAYVEEVDDRRKQFLTRNKVAASKCRAKKKQWMGELEQTAKDLSNANAELLAQLGRLRSEADILREILLAHRDCSCVKVQQFVQSGSTKMHLMGGLSLPTMPPPRGMHHMPSGPK